MKKNNRTGSHTIQLLLTPLLHHNSTVIRRVTMVRTERGVRLMICQGDGAITKKMIKLTRLELFYEEKL